MIYDSTGTSISNTVSNSASCPIALFFVIVVVVVVAFCSSLCYLCAQACWGL